MATLLLSAWALVLSRYSGMENVLFGALCSGRPATLAGSEYMVGFFNNILPLRVPVLPEAQLLPWLKDVQAHMVELREYEYTPMMKIKEWAGLDQTLPMFDSYVVYENFPTYSYETIGKKARKDLGMQAPDDRRFFVPTEYPIRVEFWSSQPLMMTMSGYQRYCDSVTLARLLKQLKIVLEGMVTHPTQRLGDVIRLIGRE
jgi:non-ribosomal peptide synthetase component F